ncbi:hypothetical protein GGI07_001618 [Coemansia sp. Benny D115]|nr:hypothetical protein GGI07_001618 [Coemansia sp. Benny D115]
MTSPAESAPAPVSASLSATAPAFTPTPTATSSTRGRRPGRGRGGNRPAHHSHDSHQRSAATEGRPKNRSRNNSGSATAASASKGAASTARPKNGEAATEANAGDADDAEDVPVCFICADTIKFYAIGECDHRTCSLCNLRLRALFKSKACPYCKTELESIIYTQDSESIYEELAKTSLPFADKSLGIKFDSKEAYDSTMHTLQFNCPHTRCRYVADEGWGDLKGHVRNTHSLQFCDLCLKHKMSFTNEHRLYTKSQLRNHYAKGDSAGFVGHPMCRFCNISFYDNDQLFEHCRQKHEQCFICVRNGTGRHVYFANYNTLEEHFNKTHHPCKHSLCLEKKFVVFENEIDLQSHELEEHGSSIVGQKARREAKHINVNFQYSSARGGEGTSRGGSSGSGPSSRGGPGGSRRSNTASADESNRSRPRPSAEEQPPATMTVNGPDDTGVSIAGRQRPSGFGRVTESNNPRQRQQQQQQQQQQPDPSSYSYMAASTPDASSSEADLEPESLTIWPTLQADTAQSSSSARDRAPAAFGRLSETPNQTRDAASISEETINMHQELLQRVSTYLSHRDQPVSRFRELTKQFKNSEVSAQDYVQNCWLLFLTVPGKNAKEMIQRTIKTVASLLPDKKQSDALLLTLAEHRIKQQQFPALTPLTGSSTRAGSSAGGSSARVLVIKETSSKGKGKAVAAPRSGWNKPVVSSASSSRASSPRLRNDNATAVVAKPSYSSSTLSHAGFPSLGAANSSSTSVSSLASRFTGLSATAPSSAHNSYSTKFTQTSSSTGGASAYSSAGGLSKPKAVSNDNFPDLPPATVPKRKVVPLNPNATSAWEGPSISPTASQSLQNPGNRRPQRSNNGKGKQVLFHVG